MFLLSTLRTMPSGRTHDRITLWSLPFIIGLGVGITRSAGLTLWIASGFLLGGLMLGPDLDIRSVQYKRWGCLRWIWIPYRGSLKHRSPLSHAPIIGTSLRIVYLGAWLSLAGLVALALLNEVAQLGWTWAEVGDVFWRSLQQYRWQWLSLAIGLELGACSHYMADWLVSTYKRRTKKRRRTKK